MPNAPAHAQSLREESEGYSELKAGAWFKCNCGRIGHISELLSTKDTTQMWCPMCRKDNWNWTNNGVAQTA